MGVEEWKCGDGAVLEQVGIVGLKGAPWLLLGVLLGVEECKCGMGK